MGWCDGSLAPGQPADILVLDLDSLDRDAIMPVAPIDLLFARASSAHIERLYVAGREVVREGNVVGIDLEAAQIRLREDYRAGMSGRQSFLDAWGELEPLAARHYQGMIGCC